MSHVSLGLSNLCACRYPCGGHHFSGPTDCYQQRTISTEPQGGPLLGSF
uniref:Uncharacterized protein n=1 Tax=Arundo donax TaxID=35708 RepID=A0A0A9DC52_ARUDO